MAYEAVVTSVAEKLEDLLIQEAPLFKREITWIHTELNKLRCFMKDADSRQSKDRRVKNWVAQIRDLCYDLEDVLEDLYTFLEQSAKKGDGFLDHLKRPFSVRSELRTRHEVAKRIERLKQKMSDISSKREDYGIRDINKGRREASSSNRDLEGCRQVFEPEVVGQQEEISTLKKQLINGEQRRCVISIVGMGGIGKTTLARKVYHDVKNDFDCHAFICLSQQYYMEDVLIRLITCAMGKLRREIENLTKEVLGMMLCEHLKRKRYLVVVDDIWSTEGWDDLNLILPDTGQSKSRVMLTTRIKDVAVHADRLSPLHEMRLLNADEGWELFMKKVFPGENPFAACSSKSEETLEETVAACSSKSEETLKETGREIVAKCGGLPLAILLLGGLLATKEKTSREWSKVLESLPWHLTGSSDSCMNILALSYWDLPYYLKPCFLYLGLFPEDYKIGSGRLIRLWIAEGFIVQRGGQIMEDVAEDYLEELVHRSMIQLTSSRSNGSIRTCRIHDLVREFSISEARQNNFFAIHNNDDISSSLTSNDDISSSLTSVRRLALYHRVDETNHLTATLLRSIFYFPGSEVHSSQLPNMGGKFLRVFVAEGAEFTKEQLFKEVGAFVNLKYLELSRCIDESLPSSIGNLYNLQTLKLLFPGTLPNAIWNLAELRHLSCFYFNTEEHPKLKKLGDLQTLKLSAGSWIGDGLGKLSNLRKLGICGNLTRHEALSYSIDKLSNLRSLKLYEGHSIPPFASFSHHSALYKMYWDGKIERLPKLPQAMVELTLKNSLLRPDAISTLGQLPRLKILRLLHKSYADERMICSSSGFPRLELLKLCELPLECLIVEEGAMMSLKSVELFQVSKLKIETLPERVHVHALLEQN